MNCTRTQFKNLNLILPNVYNYLARGPPQATTSGWNGGAVGGSGVSAWQGRKI